MINKKADTAMEYQPSFPASPPAGASPLSLILQGVSLPEKQRTSNCRPAKRRADDADFTRYNDGMNPKQMGDFMRADDADFTRYNDGMNPKQMGDFISQTNNAL